MKALVKKHASPGLWLEDVDMPSIGETDVLIKIKKTAICGTDVHIYQWDEWASKTINTPMVIGHEFVGEVVQLGSRVKNLKVGDRVSGEGHLVCGHCRNCRSGKMHLCPHTIGLGVNRPGCFAQYLSFPADNLYVVPNGISDDQASFLDPLGNAVHTALSYSLIGEDVLITGAGPIGLMAVAIARHAGARNVVITDLNDFRLDIAKKMGANAAVNVAKQSLKEVLPSLDIKYGFDVILEMSGSPKALSSAIDVAFHGAKIALLGILPKHTEIDWHQVIFKGLFIKGIYGREMFDTWYKMGAMLQSGLDVSSVITHKYAFEDYQKGFEAMISGNCGKVILEL
jgi:threonine 3-dehydrogenase